MLLNFLKVVCALLVVQVSAKTIDKTPCDLTDQFDCFINTTKITELEVHQCISVQLVCDHMEDCENGADEQECEAMIVDQANVLANLTEMNNCNDTDQFDCFSNSSITFSNSSITFSNSSITFSNSSITFSNSSIDHEDERLQCISTKLVCNQVEDCENGADEQDCEGAVIIDHHPNLSLDQWSRTLPQIITEFNHNCSLPTDKLSQCNNRTTNTIYTANTHAVEEGLKISDFGDYLESLSYFTPTRHGNHSIGLNEAAKFAEHYNSVIRNASNSLFSWTRGGGLSYRLDLLFKSAIQYGEMFSNTYNESMDGVKTVLEVDTNGRLKIVNVFDEYNISVTSQQEYFLENNDIKSDMITEFLQDAKRRATNVKTTTIEGEERLLTFNDALKFDNAQLESLVNEFLAIIETLNKEIIQQNLLKVAEHNKLDELRISLENDYNAEIEEAVEKEITANKQVMGIKGAGNIAIMFVVTLFPSPMSAAMLRVSSPHVINYVLSHPAPPSLSSLRDEANRGKTYMDVLFSSDVTTIERAYIISRIISNAAISDSPHHMYLTILSLKPQNLRNKESQALEHLEKILKLQIMADISLSVIDDLAFHKAEIIGIYGNFVNITYSINNLTRSVRFVNDLFTYVIDNLSSIINTFKIRKCENEKINFVEICINNMKCHWDES